MSSQNSAAPPGWYRDPAGGAHERYFDGTGWSTQTRPVTLLPRTPHEPAQTSTAAWAPATAPTIHTPPSQMPAATVFGIDPSTGMPAFPSHSQPHPAAAGAVTDHATLPRSDVAGRSTAPVAVLDAVPQSPPGAAAAAAPGRRSLQQAIAEPVDSLAAQRFLLGAAAELPPLSLRAEPATSPAGWYPDPARSGALRFFDGTQWTSRTRRPVDEGIRRLPAAALRLRAAFLEAQDAAALRRGEKHRPERVTIHRARNVPSLAARTHQSSSIMAMLATLVVIVSLAVAGYFAWQLWGSDWWNVRQQAQLEQELEQSPGTGWGDVPVIVQEVPVDPGESLPTATATPAPGDTSTAAPKPTGAKPVKTSARPPTPRPAPSSAPRPGGSSHRTTQRVTIAPNTTADGKPVGHIRIPRIGLDRVFVLGTEAEQLATGPGLWKWGVFPGTPGNSTISGHRGGNGAPFRYLNRLKYGDEIIVDVPGQPRAVFEVRGRTIADPFDVQVTRQTAGVRLTLTTCHPVGSDAERLVIEAELVSGKFKDQAMPRNKWVLLK